MKINLTGIYFISVILTVHFNLLAQNAHADPGSIPWDSLFAEIETIRAADLPDSTESQLIAKFLHRYRLSSRDYQKFYDKFFQKSINDQIHFLNKVEKIIIDKMRKEQHLPYPRKFVKPKSKSAPD